MSTHIPEGTKLFQCLQMLKSPNFSPSLGRHHPLQLLTLGSAHIMEMQFDIFVECSYNMWFAGV